jgi:uncharacterized protein YjbI with pentapeptide repeats
MRGLVIGMMGVVCALTATVASAGLTLNGANENGIRLQGWTLNGANENGIRLQGLTLNGAGENGIRLQGLTLNGAGENGIRLQGIDPNGQPVAGTLVVATMKSTGVRVQGMKIVGGQLFFDTAAK